MQKTFENIKEIIKKSPLVSGLLVCLLLGTVITCVTEIISRMSLVSFFVFSCGSTMVFVYNCLIVALMLGIARFFKRRLFAYSFVGIFWIALAVINAILQHLRPSPITAYDFALFLSAYEITTSYLTAFQILLVFAVSAVVISFMVFLFCKSKRVKPDYKVETLVLSVVMALFVMLSLWGNASGFLRINFSNINSAYDEYGFEYCFFSTVFGSGVNKPENYSDKTVTEILSNLSSKGNKNVDDETLPNIIFVQLESFFDLKYYNEYKPSENPCPNFTFLKEKFPNGLLEVPVFGGGTANTEFEVLTGMRIEYFSGGEIPFETVLKKGICESIPFNLKKYGYVSTALHNHTGTFYDRHEVYANLGFDRFVPAEYMQGITYTPVGWERDEVLTKYIMDSLTSTQGKDFVFAVSVQGHGGYPKEGEGFNLPITLENDDGSEQAFSTRYYANQLREIDDFVGRLILSLEEFDEKTVVVFYGDHLPAMRLTNEKLSEITTYHTEYVIYSNYGLEVKIGENPLLCNRLASEVLKAVGIDGGHILKFNQITPVGEKYANDLNIIQYELLYGERFEEFRKSAPADMTLGLSPVAITYVWLDGEKLNVYCDNSTYKSVIFVNGKECFTKYYSETHLMTEEMADIRPGDIITVCQVTDGGFVLSSSEPYMYKE